MRRPLGRVPQRARTAPPRRGFRSLPRFADPCVHACPWVSPGPGRRLAAGTSFSRAGGGCAFFWARPEWGGASQRAPAAGRGGAGLCLRPGRRAVLGRQEGPRPPGDWDSGPQTLLNVEDGRGNPVQLPRLPAGPFLRDWPDGRLQRGKFCHTAKQCCFCDTMLLLRVVRNSVCRLLGGG